MSLQAMTLVLDFAPEHWTSGRRMVAIAVADRVGQDGTTWCSVADVSQRTGLNERMVQRHIQGLVNEGVLLRTPRKRDNGSQQSNLWTWLWILPRGGGAQYTGGVACSTPHP